MARNLDITFRDKLKNYIKTEWMKAGQQMFSKTIKEITKDLYGESKPTYENKVWHYLNILENQGYIKITKGEEKGNPNWYSFLSENAIEQISNVREECIDTLDQIINAGNDVLQRFSNAYADISNKLISTTGKLNHYEQALSELNFFGINPSDGQQIFTTNKNSEINLIIEQIKKERQKELQKKDNAEDNINEQ